MSGNTTTSNNFTGLYGASAGTVVPTTPYGNANVVSLLAVGTDGANTVGNIVAAGNVTANYFLGNGSQLSGLPVSYSNANVVTLLAAFGSNVISTTGNITSGNIATAGVVTATGNITGSNIRTAGVVTATGNITGGNIRTAGVVTATGNITGGNLITTGQVTATGNISTAGYFLGTFAGNISGNLTVPGSNTQVLFNNQGNAGASAGFTFDSASNVMSVTGNAVGGNIITAGVVSAAGNITGNYFLGNGSQLTGLPATYGNANVATYLASGTLNSNIITTANVQGAFLTTSGASGNIIGVNYMSANFYLGNGSQLTGIVATSVGVLPSLSVTGNTQTGNLLTGGVVSATGNVTGGNILTVGQVSATGNITGNFFIGNGSLLTGISGGGTYSNANVSNFLANGFGSNSISTTGNITAGLFVGNASLLTSITGANVTGTVANATYALNANNSTFAGTVTTNAQPNITSVGTLTSLSVTGNTDTGNLRTTGLVSATGNVTGGNILTTAVQATGSGGVTLKNSAGATQASYGAGGGDNFAINVSTNLNGNNAQIDISPTGTGHVHIKPTGTGAIEIAPTSTGSINNMIIGNATPAAINATTASASGNITGGNILTVGEVSATGNVTGNFFIGNGSQLTGIAGGGGSPGGANTQIQFNNASAFGGNANLTFNNSTGNVNLGNVIFTTSNVTNFLNTVTPSAGTPTANATAFNSSQIIIGNGWQGNLNLNNQIGISSARGSKLFYWDTIPITDSGGPRVNGLGSNPFVILQGNVSNTNTRLSAFAGSLIIGGSANNFQYTTSTQFAATGISTGVNAGQGSTNQLIGNTTVTNMTGVASSMNVNGASNVGNSSGFYTAVTPANTAYLQTAAGLVIQFTGAPTVASDNVFGVYMNGNTSAGILGGTVNSNGMRKAANYYFLRNDDNLAQNKLGSLRLFNEYRYDGANTTGTLAVDKNNGQVQNVYLTGNITSVTFSNFVTSASDGTTTDYQTDTVTLILRQDSTGYTVTMPTGSAYKYAAGTSTVGTTANSATMISVTATYDSITAADQYLITISPEFT